MLEKTKLILKQSGARLRSAIADSQCSDDKLRRVVDETVIPYPANQKHGVKGVLRVIRSFEPADRKSRIGSIIRGRT